MSDSQNSYSRILKSSSIVGGVQGFNILIGMVRVKFVAILIGPLGVGLFGSYKATIQLIQTICGLGLQSSAVRDIAQASASGDHERIARIVLSLRRMCWLTGGVGSLVVALSSRYLSQITFGGPEHAMSIALVGLTILFGNLRGGQTALIQAMRRIGDLARLNVFGVLTGSIVSVGLYYAMGIQGIVPAIVVVGMIDLSASWWFARKIQIAPVQLSWRESFREAGGMVKLGLAFMWSSFLVAMVAYLTRVLITREIDLVAVGIFSAAFALSGMVVNFVLGAMGVDYFPSLTAVNEDRDKMRDLVNQQTEIGILLAMPALLATLAFAPWVIRIFYSSEFTQSSDLLQWFAVGCIGRVISWPLGYIILALGKARLFTLSETLANVVHIVLIWVGLTWLGLEGCAIAFAAFYVMHIVFMYGVARRLISFSWSAGVWRIKGVLIPVVVVTFAVVRLLPLWPATLAGGAITLITGVICLRELARRLGDQHRICLTLAKVPVIQKLV